MSDNPTKVCFVIGLTPTEQENQSPEITTLKTSVAPEDIAADRRHHVMRTTYNFFHTFMHKGNIRHVAMKLVININ